jgi:dihydrofolate reductase
MKNSIFIGTSLDGYIADKYGGLDYLHAIPNPTNDDMGYHSFISSIDAIIMGRTTFETVCSFDGEWPYQVPVFVLSNTLTEIPSAQKGKAYLAKGSLTEDGGKTIQSFLQEDLIDEMIITSIPILLGGGFSLFGELTSPMLFKCVKTTILVDAIVQSRFIRERE